MLPVVILQGHGEPDRRKPGLKHFDMIAAAAEAVPAPDLTDIESRPGPAGEPSNEPGYVARRRIIFAAQPSLLVDQCGRRIRADALRKNTHMAALTAAVGTAAVPD